MALACRQCSLSAPGTSTPAQPAVRPITLYASANGTTPGQVLQVIDAASSGRGEHTQTVPASFADLPGDYYLLGKVDSNDSVAEVDEDDNREKFEGGAFVNNLPGGKVLTVHGTDFDDNISVGLHHYLLPYDKIIEDYDQPQTFDSPIDRQENLLGYPEEATWHVYSDDYVDRHSRTFD